MAFHARFDRRHRRGSDPRVHEAIARTQPARPGSSGRVSAIAARVRRPRGGHRGRDRGRQPLGVGGFRPQRGRRTFGRGLPAPSATSPSLRSPPATVLELPVVDVRRRLRPGRGSGRSQKCGQWAGSRSAIFSCGPGSRSDEPVSPRANALSRRTHLAEEGPRSHGHRQPARSPLPQSRPEPGPRRPRPNVGAAAGRLDGAIPAPAHVVVLGHFDDRRALLCPSAETTACRDRFVVDTGRWVDGREPQPSTMDRVDGAAATIVAGDPGNRPNEAPGSLILSTVDGRWAARLPQGRAVARDRSHGAHRRSRSCGSFAILESERVGHVHRGRWQRRDLRDDPGGRCDPRRRHDRSTRS